MLLRRDDRGVLAIGQPAHAWVSGQLARAWGNARFGRVEPWEEVSLAAEQHDIGMAAWDLEPAWNPETGLPYTFLDMPIETHMELWRAGPRRLIRQSRYAALLASRHGTRLYAQRDLDALTPAQANTVRGFLAANADLQRHLVEALAGDPETRASVAPAALERNSALIATWDRMSLALCLGWPPYNAPDVPAAEGRVAIAISPAPRPGELLVDPWPFAGRAVPVRTEGQRLAESYADPTAQLIGMAHAPWETLAITLRPGRASSAATGR